MPTPLSVVIKFYEELRGTNVVELLTLFYIKKDKHAADHLFRVAAGIDSMVIGENQIVSQLKDAYSSACAVKSAGKVIHRLFHQAFRTGKQVRTDTDMGKGACSVSSAAVELVRQRRADLPNLTAVFIGANQMITLAAEGISSAGCENLIFINRTPEKAEILSRKFSGAAYPLTSLGEILPRADLVITCTASTDPILTDSLMNRVWDNVKSSRMMIVDLAVPRDTLISADKFSGLEIYDLDDIKHFVESEQVRRELAIPQAEEIIAGKLEQYMYWFDNIRQEPIYNGLEEAFDIVRREETESLLDRLPFNLREEFDAASRRLTARLLQMHIRASEPSRKME
jgi:glutamyl-tRNA reductase